MTNLFTRTRKAIACVAILAGLCAATAFAQGPYSFPPTWVYARAYANWSIAGQQASTYTFNGGNCSFAPLNNGVSANFFAFSGFQGSTTVYNPVFIQDINPALSEIVTPTSITNTGASCGFAGTVVNAHTSFTLTSGTAGLQEAVTNANQSAPVFYVVLDKYWYQLVSGLSAGTPGPGLTSGAAIISKLTGSTNVSILDTTTSPFTTYSWNGTNYVAASPSGGIAFTSVTPVVVPTALSTAAASLGLITTSTTGGSIPASGTYRLGATCVTALGGETTLSVDSASAATIAVGATATNTITVTSPAGCTAALGAVGWRLYMTAASGASLSEILYTPTCTASTGQFVLTSATVCAIGASATITAVITGTATVPAISTAFLVPGGSTSPLQAIVSYPPFTALGTLATTVVGTVGAVNYPAGFLNSLGRHLHVHGTGYGTTNGTGGTLTFASTLASVPGVTSITPFTVASPAIAASVITVNYVFDFDITTTAVGATGTVECHGTVSFNVAGTAVSSPAQDFIIAASSTVDLTKQDQLAFTIKPTTAGLTAAQLRQVTVQVVQ